VEFTADGKSGKVSREITLVTDAQGDELVFTAFAQIVEPADSKATN
jgi:hypothetical protein